MLYKYGLKYRGVSIGTQPKNFVKFEDVDKKETGYYSYVYYDRKLTQDELYKYEMNFIETVNS